MLVKSENQAEIWPLSIVFYLLPSDQLELVRIEGVFGPFRGCCLTVRSLLLQVCTSRPNLTSSTVTHVPALTVSILLCH